MNNIKKLARLCYNNEFQIQTKRTACKECKEGMEKKHQLKDKASKVLQLIGCAIVLVTTMTVSLSVTQSPREHQGGPAIPENMSNKKVPPNLAPGSCPCAPVEPPKKFCKCE